MSSTVTGIKALSIVKTSIITTMMILASGCMTTQTTKANSYNRAIDPVSIQAGNAGNMVGVFSSQDFLQSYSSAPNIKAEHIGIAYNAEQTASAAATKVLSTVREMALDDREIVQGACWDYLNTAFNRAGVGRDTVFKGAYPNGAFIDTDRIQPGDWLYYVNHSYHDIQHSGLFVGWVDAEQNEALILSYAGESRREPARYKIYDVSHTYNVMRPSL